MSITERTLYFAKPTDLVTSGVTVTTSGTADSAYPLTNLVDLSYAKLAAPAKLTGTSGAFVLDFGSAQRVDGVLLWHNFDAALAVAVQMHASNSWGAPTVTTSPTIPAKRADGYTRKVFVDLRSVSGYSTGGFRYLRINVSGTNSVALGLKVAIVSTLRTLPRDFEWQGFETIHHQVGIDMTTDALHPWAYDLAAAPRVITGTGLWADADVDTIVEWHRACAGRSKLTLVVPEPSTNEGMLARWAEGPASVVSPGVVLSRLSVGERYYDGKVLRLAFEEITAGDPEWE